MTKKSDEEKKRAIQIIKSGSEVAGTAIGAAIGLVGSPVGLVGGAAAGALIGQFLRKAGSEISQRVLGPREEIRVGAVLAFAGTEITDQLKQGRKPREDGFFEPQNGSLSSADELLEGVLQKARDSYEEKKLRLLGIMYANIVFSKEITPSTANHLIVLAGQLTYRQLVGLAIAQEQKETSIAILRDSDSRNSQEDNTETAIRRASLLTEIYDLDQRGLITDVNGSAWISVSGVNPGSMRAAGAGVLLAMAMALQSIPQEDRQEYYEMFPKQKL